MNQDSSSNHSFCSLPISLEKQMTILDGPIYIWHTTMVNQGANQVETVSHTLSLVSQIVETPKDIDIDASQEEKTQLE